MRTSSGLVVRVVVGIALLGYAAIRFTEQGAALGPVLAGAVGLFFVVRGLATSERK